MNPTTHHLTSSYLQAYTGELADDLRAARVRNGGHRIRRSMGRAMVALGARLSPDSTMVVDGHVVLLEPATSSRGLQRAA